MVTGLGLAGGCSRPDGTANAPPSFELHPDFRMQLVAVEPTVLDPVDLELDEAGRAFVLEMPGYPFAREGGRVVLLRDEDGDGVWESRQVFAEELGVADSILPYRGGLLVAAPPDLLLLEDDDGDGVAEERTVLLSGFTNGNPQHNFNGLTHGLDNWIHGTNGGNSGEVYWPEKPEERTPLRFDDFRVDPESRRLERTGRSAGGFEMTFDSWGRSYSTHNLVHASHLVFPGRYLEGLPAAWRSSRAHISDHGDGPARIYPIGVQETRVNHPEQAGHFSGACGITAYTGGAFAAGFADNLFVADVVLNLVHRAVLRTDGAVPVASRVREGVEFLASSDRSFRPVNLTVGPDGALYLLDMHRRVIEHPEWIPDELEADLDLDAGKDRGRIYRITPRRGLPRVDGRLDRSDPESLVDLLGHPNGWWRTTAQRLLVEERATGVLPALAQAAREGGTPHHRLHALFTLSGLGAATDELLLAALADPHPRLRESALVLAEPRLAHAPELRQASLALAKDADPRVRMQVALSLGTLGSAAPLGPILDVAASLPEDDWLRLAVLSALSHRAFESVDAILDRKDLLASEGGRELLRRTSRLVDAGQARELLHRLSQGHDEEAVVAAVLDGFVDGFDDRLQLEGASLSAASRAWLRATGRSLGPLTRYAWRLEQAFGLAPSAGREELEGQVAERVLDPALPPGARLEALALFAVADFDVRRPVLFELLDPRQPVEIQRTAVAQLASVVQPDVAAELLGRWRALGPEVRREVGTLLLRRRDYHPLLLDALEAGRVTLGELNLHLERRRALLRSDDPRVSRRAAALFTDAGVVTRSEAIAAMRPALELTGEPAAGERLFAELCARCHRYREAGVEVGPDLTEIARKSPQTLLHDILDPNAAVEVEYLSYAVRTADGRLLSGLLRAESDDALLLRQAGGVDEEIRRHDVQELWTDGLSLMPEELELGLEPQDLADLLAFLRRPGA